MSEGLKTLSARIFTWPYWPVILMILSLKALIFLFGAISYQVHANLPIKDVHRFLAIWNRWDAIHYLNLAKEGYATAAETFKYIIVFFPLYPWTVRIFEFLSGRPVLSAFAVSGLASIAAGLLLYRLARLDESEETSLKSVFFLFVFPASYFLHIAYPESLFLVLVLATFLSARKRCWIFAGILGALAALTRLSGILLIPALVWEAFSEFREIRRFRRSWLFIGLVVAGFVVYLFLNAVVHSNPFQFLEMYKEYWGKVIAWPWQGVFSGFQSLSWRNPSEDQMIVAQETFYLLLGFVATIYGFRRIRTSYVVWMALNWLLLASVSFLQSIPRYTLVLFPIFILFARLSSNRVWAALITTWSLLFLALFISLFVEGRWAF